MKLLKQYARNNKWRHLIGIPGMVILCLLFFTGKNFANSSSSDIRDMNHLHEVAYQQEELAGLIHTYFEDQSIEKGNQENIIQEYLVSEIHINWTLEQLEGKILLEVSDMKDGCVVFTAFDMEHKVLALISVNQSEEVQATKVVFEEINRENPAAVRTYTVENEIGDDGTENTDKNAIDGESDIEQNASQETEEELAYEQTYTAEDEPDDKEESGEEEELEPNFVLTKEDEQSHDKSSDGLYAIMQPEGCGVVEVETGMIYGGALTTNEQLADPVTALSLVTGPATFTNNAHGLLRIYSLGDSEAETGNDVGTAGDYATYSLSSHLIYYDVDETTIITVNRGTSGYQPYHFKIELHNSDPVTIKHLDSRALGDINNQYYKFRIEALGSDNTLNIVNNEGHAIDFGRYLTLAGSGTINAEGSIYGITTTAGQNYINTWGAFINLTGGFELNASGEEAGIYLYSTRAPELASTEACPSLNVTEGSRVIADAGNNADGYGIYIRGEVYAGKLSYVEGSGAGTGIYANRVIADQAGEPEADNSFYACKTDLSNEKRTRIAGFGSSVGIELNTESDYTYPYVGKGTLIYAEGEEKGMLVRNMATRITTAAIEANSNTGRPALSNESTDALLYGTIMAVGTDSQSVGLEVHFPAFPGADTTPTTNVRYGTRYVVQGGTHGLYKTAPNNYKVTIKFEYLSELLAYGKTGAGVYMDTAGYNPYTYLSFDNKSAGYARGGQYGIYINAGAMEVFGVNSGYDVPMRRQLDPNNQGMGSQVTAIGGIGSPENPTGGMEPGILADPVVWMTAAGLEISDIPEPEVDDNGVVRSTLDADGNVLPEKRNTYGILVRNYSYIAAYDRKTRLKMYGGHIAGATVSLSDIGKYEDVQRNYALNGTYICSYEGAILEGYGGEYGNVANTYIHAWSQGYDGNRTAAPINDGTVPTAESYLTGNSILKGAGSRYGLLTLGNNIYNYGYITTLGSLYNNRLGRSYIYGYGEVNGIRAQGTGGNGYVEAVPGSMIVAETVVDARATGDHPHAQPAIVSSDNFRSYTATQNMVDKGIIHEMYQTLNVDIVSMPPYALNTEVEAIGKQLGTTPGTLLKLNWTTPEYHPNESTDGRHWLDYDENDDQKLIKPGTVNGESGLISFGDTSGTTLTGNGIGCISTISTGKLGSGINAFYRITFDKVKGSTRNTMNVEADLYEDFLGTKTHFHDGGSGPIVPLETVYELRYQNPDDPQNPVVVELAAGDELDTAVGRIRLTKLGMGEYWLKPKKDIGYPYGGLPEIHFMCQFDTSVAVPGENTTSYPNYADYWYEKLYLLDDGGSIPSAQSTDEHGSIYIKSLLNTDEDGRPYAEITERGTKITDGSGRGEPTFDHNVEAYRVGKMDLSYFYQKHKVDFALKDIDSRINIPGSFELTASRNGQALPGLTETISGTEDISGDTNWQGFEAYPGTDYTLKQLTTDKTPYLKTTEAYTFQVDAQDGSYMIIETAPQEYYEGGTPDEMKAEHYVYAYNDLPTVEVRLHLIDKELYEENTLQSHLETKPGLHILGGAFRMQAAYTSDPEQMTDVADEYITDHHDGTFTLKLKPHRTRYELTQTAAADGYSMRRTASSFALENLTYNSDGTAITSYEIRNAAAGVVSENSGWVEPDGWDKMSAWITNEKRELQLSFYKTDTTGNPMEGVKFALYECKMKDIAGHIHERLAEQGSCWDATALTETVSATDGWVDFGKVYEEDYMLVELETLEGYALPNGQWLISVGGEDDLLITAKYKGVDPPPAFKTEEREGGEVYVLTNYKYTELPMAGKRGVFLMIITGTCVAALAIIGFWLKSRIKAFENR